MDLPDHGGLRGLPRLHESGQGGEAPGRPGGVVAQQHPSVPVRHRDDHGRIGAREVLGAVRRAAPDPAGADRLGGGAAARAVGVGGVPVGDRHGLDEDPGVAVGQGGRDVPQSDPGDLTGVLHRLAARLRVDSLGGQVRLFGHGDQHQFGVGLLIRPVGSGVMLRAAQVDRSLRQLPLRTDEHDLSADHRGPAAEQPQHAGLGLCPDGLQPPVLRADLTSSVHVFAGEGKPSQGRQEVCGAHVLHRTADPGHAVAVSTAVRPRRARTAPARAVPVPWWV